MNCIEPKEEALEQSDKIKDKQILHYIWSVIERYRQRKEENSLECILCQEKLVHVSLIVLKKDPEVELPYDLKEEITRLVQKINKLAMENIKETLESNSSKFISKAVDIIMLPQICQHITNTVTLLKLKILTFNNLACVLKSSKHYMMALKAVSFAVDMEEQMIKNRNEEQQYDIVATYLNKTAILSEMGKHGKALQEIRKARAYAQKIEKDVDGQIRESKDSQLTRRLEQKRHYGLYMKMLISYSIGVEKEHQKLISSAISYYQEGKRLAIMIDNQLMANKLEDIILKLKKQ